MSARSAEVIVIGAGVVGASVAFELASLGRRVRVADMRHAGGGASQASAGILAPWIEGHHSEGLRTLGLRSLALYDEFLDRVTHRAGLAVEFRQPGTLEIAVGDADVERLTQSATTLADVGVAAEWMDGTRARAIEPTLTPHAVGALKIPSHAVVNVPAFTLAAVAAARAAGATFSEGLSVTGLDAGGDGVVVRSTQGDLTAPHVVLATGSWSSALAPDGARPAPVRPVRGQLVHLRTPPGTLRHVVWGAHVYLVPWSDGTIYVGATSEDVGFDERATVEGVSSLLAATATLTPGLARATFIEARAGLRPGTDDTLPFIGPSAALPGLVYACGHFRNGALLAPLTATLVARAVQGDLSDPAFSLVNPARAGRL